MSRWFYFICFLLVSFSTSVFSSYEALVIRVTDGDSVLIKDEDNLKKKVRLFGIDAPEFTQRDGPKAGRYLASRIGGEMIRVEEIDTDQYGRVVAMIYDMDDINLNQEMIQFGLAWVYLNYYDNAEWIRMEKEARENKIGIWRRKTVQAPWEYRKQSKQSL